MRASTEQIRDLTLEAVDVAKDHVSELVNSGAERLSASVGQGAAGVGDRIDRVADAVPTVSLEIARHRRRSLTRGLLLALLVAVVGVAVVGWLRTRAGSDADKTAGSSSSSDGPEAHISASS